VLCCLQIEHDDAIEDILALESAEPPRFHGKSKLLAAPGLSADAAAAARRAKKHTPEQKARRRARQREAYLAQLQAAGKYEPSRAVKPDPERWIAKKDRSYGKRGRKNRGKFVGGQGSADGSQKDMLKLDAHARALQKKEQDEAAAAALTASKSGSTRQKQKRR
jgi:signal recognition particle subunit SRP72